MGPTLHQALLMVSDLEESHAFYEEMLGLEPAVVDDGNVEFATGDGTLVLESDFDDEVLDAFGLERPGDDRGRGVIVALDVGDPDAVDTICERVAESDRTVRMEPQDVGWGRRMALIADPDDYTVEISAALPE